MFDIVLHLMINFECHSKTIIEKAEFMLLIQLCPQ